MGLIDLEDKREMSYKLVSEMFVLVFLREFVMVVKVYLNVWKSIDVEIKIIEK